MAFMLTDNRILDDNGRPLSGGKVYVYEAGTTTPIDSFPTAAAANAGTPVNSNPVILNAGGIARIYGKDDVVYKVVIKDRNDTTIETIDNISLNGGESAAAAAAAALAASASASSAASSASAAESSASSAAASAEAASESAIAAQASANLATPTVVNFTGDGSTTDFELPYAAGKSSTNVFVSGQYQGKGAYAIVSGTTLRFLVAPANGVNIEVNLAATSTMVSGDTTQVNYNNGASGAVTRNVRDKLREIVSVKDFGADSAAFQKAIDHVSNAGGGTVLVPGGVWEVEGLKPRPNVYIDCRGAVLRLPSDATQPMFVADAQSSFSGGGFIGGEFDGRDKAQACFDFSAVERLTSIVFDNVYIHDFDIGFKGSQNDRFPVFRHCRIHANNTGMSVSVNHPILDHCDFRDNDIGLTGSMNDLYAVGCKFNYNRIGVEPDESVGSGFLRNSYFVACMFFRNTEVAIRLSRQCWVSSSLFVGVDSGDVGVILEERDCRVTDCQFGHDSFADGHFGDSCIKYSAGRFTNCQRMLIANNTFRIHGSGVGISSSIAPGSGASVRNAVIQGNQVALGGGKKWIVIEGSMQHPLINGNAIQVESSGMGEGEGIIEIGNLTSLGGTITNNVFASLESNTGGYCLKLPDVTDSIIGFNKFRNFSDPIYVSAGSSDARWVANVGAGLTPEEEG